MNEIYKVIINLLRDIEGQHKDTMSLKSSCWTVEAQSEFTDCRKEQQVLLPTPHNLFNFRTTYSSWPNCANAKKYCHIDIRQ